MALSVWKVRPEDAIAVIEAGISSIGEMGKLEAMIQPDIVVLCHIGDAHDAGFPNREAKIEEKLSLAKNFAQTLCLPAHLQEVVDFIKSPLAKELIEGKNYAFGMQKHPKNLDFLKKSFRSSPRALIHLLCKAMQWPQR